MLDGMLHSSCFHQKIVSHELPVWCAYCWYDMLCLMWRSRQRGLRPARGTWLISLAIAFFVSPLLMWIPFAVTNCCGHQNCAASAIHAHCTAAQPRYVCMLADVRAYTRQPDAYPSVSVVPAQPVVPVLMAEPVIPIASATTIATAAVATAPTHVVLESATPIGPAP